MSDESEEYNWDPKMIDAMAEDIVDFLHVAAPEEMVDDEVHDMGKIVLLLAIQKLGGFLPGSLN